MARPRPVPPYLRVVDPSACVNGWKIRSWASGEIPIPESPTSNRRLVPWLRASTDHNAQMDFAAIR